MVTMRDLLECGVHFGHQTRRWNPKMKKYIFGERKGIYIIDLQKTIRYFRYTYNIVRDAAAAGKTVLFVGTKKQAIQAIKDSAEKCGMPYVNSRWLGGMMTNFGTIKQSIRKLEVIEAMEEDGSINLLTEEVLGGIRNMKNLPDMIFVIDTVKEKIAVAEANKLKIEIVAPVDTNCDPDLITYPVPANDDAIRAVQLFCNEMAEAINEGKAMMDPEVAVANEEAISEAEKQEVLEEAMSEEE